MKIFILALLTSCSFAWNVWQDDSAGMTLGKKQQAVNRLLFKPTEPIRDRFTLLKQAAKNFNPVADKSIYKDGGKAAKMLMKELNDHRLLKQHHWFSLFNTRQRKEALMLFDVLMVCKNSECFFSNAAFFRERMNEGEFIYALYVATIHSELMNGVILPPLYEVTPHMFANSEVIEKAYSGKMTSTPGKFKMNFTGTKKNREQRVAYFGEDIGLNTHHVTWHMDFPFWWTDSYGPHFDRKGELFFWVHHQLTCRFDYERLSNHLPIVDELHWDKPIHDGFAPHAMYKYGGEFPTRPDDIHFEDVDGVAKIRDLKIMERRIRDAIAHGYVVAKDGHTINIRDEHGIDILGDIVEASMYSPNYQYFGSLHNLGHIVLGHQADPHGKYDLPPGVMEHFETATRDPAFFRLHKYIDNIFKEHKDTLQPYTKQQLIVPGIKIKNVEMSSPLETFFEDYEFNLFMAVDDSPQVPDIPLTAVVSRLNHKPFNFEITVENTKGENVFTTVRIYLCPTKDSNGVVYSMDKARWRCIELDKFWKTLSSGTNRITRKSTDSSATVPDVPHYETIVKETDAAVSAGSDPDFHKYARSCGIPNRMLLPKGNSEGLEAALIVAISDGTKDAALDNLEKDERGGTHSHCGIHGELYPDKMPLGYPLDRRIPDERLINAVPNIYRRIVMVYHN